MVLQDLLLGLYEKAIPNHFSWEEKCLIAKEAGYDFIEMSIDPSPKRLERLEWGDEKINEVRRAIEKTKVPILTMALSANRGYTLGDPEAEIRNRSINIVKKAVVLASRLGIRIIQIATYDVFGKQGTKETEKLFIENLKYCTEFASRYAVMLALETMDTPFADSISKAARFVKEVKSPFLQIYADNGNIAAMGYDFSQDIESGNKNVVAIHLKDTKPGIVRRVPYGEGMVDFGKDFVALKKVNYCGLFVAEMWCDEDPQFVPYIKTVREFLKGKMTGV